MAEYNVSLAQKLSRAGLSDKEAQIYAFLVERGGAFPTEIAKETGLNRTTVYKVLDTLSIRGLVTELEKRKKFYYQAESPKSLERFVSSQMTVAKRQIESLEQVLPVLEGLFNASPNKPIVRFFEGEEGVLNVYQDHVEVDKKYEMLSFSHTADLMKFITPEFRDNYIKNKVKLGITTRAILPDTELDINYNETIYSKFPQKIWPNVRNISKDIFPSKCDLTIYGENKVSIINFNEPHLVGTIIEDKIVHDMMRMIFELAWKGAEKKLMTGKEKLLKLEEEGKYVFHGSPSGDIKSLEPRQGTHVPDLTKPTKAMPDGRPAVSATPYAEFAIFRAIINGKNIKLDHHSGFGFNRARGGAKEFRVSSKEVLELAKDKVGCVYVFNKSDFEPYSRDGKIHDGLMEWRSYKEVVPIDVVKVSYNDMPKEEIIEITG